MDTPAPTTTTKRETNAYISRNQLLAPGLHLIGIKYNSGVSLNFKPGQFIEIGMDHPEKGFVRRAYSIASAPNSEEIELCITLVEGGLLTPSVLAYEVSTPLWVSASAKGKMTLHTEGLEGRSVYLLSTGTGIAPYISMLRANANLGTVVKTYIVHGVRSEEQLGYDAELRELAKARPNLFYIPTVTRPSSNWTGVKGRIPSLFTTEDFADMQDSGKSNVYLCGNPAMIDEVSDYLTARGHVIQKGKTQGTLHVEKFW